MTDTIQVVPNMTATLVVAAGDGPTLVNNPGPNTVFLGDNDAIRYSDAYGIVALNANGYINVDGQSDLFATIAPGLTQSLNIISGGLNFFSPPSLSGLGGAKVFVQALAPTQPPTIPLNSLWFNTTANSMEYWNGASWTTQAFSGSQLLQAATVTAAQIQNGTLTTTQIAAAAGILGAQIAANTITGANIAANTITAANIAANTITAGQLAAGIIYAGIVDGTLIQGATLRIKNGSGATIMTINISAGTWIQYLDTGSVTQGTPVASSSNAAFTDEFTNHLLAGTVTYAVVSGTIYAVQNFQGNINFLSATNWLGTWNTYASLEPDPVTGALGYFDNGGNKYYVGNRAFLNNAVPVTISSTTPGNILAIGPLEPSGQGYHVHGFAIYLGNQAAGAPIFSWGAIGGLVLGTQQNGWQRFSGGGVAPIIHNDNGALGAVTGPVFAANTTNWLYEFDVYVNVNTGGSLAVTAAENTAGDSFVINQVYAMVEHY